MNEHGGARGECRARNRARVLDEGGANLEATGHRAALGPIIVDNELDGIGGPRRVCDLIAVIERVVGVAVLFAVDLKIVVLAGARASLDAEGVHDDLHARVGRKHAALRDGAIRSPIVRSRIVVVSSGNTSAIIRVATA